MGLQQPRFGALRRLMSSRRPRTSRRKTSTLILKGIMGRPLYLQYIIGWQ
jgi:hypothetical protein